MSVQIVYSRRTKTGMPALRNQLHLQDRIGQPPLGPWETLALGLQLVALRIHRIISLE
jgi:hypothetical protein